MKEISAYKTVVCRRHFLNTEFIEPKQRVRWIDAIKGFAIILVVLGHVAERYYKYDLYPNYTVVFQWIYNVIYSFHMPLFMIISGYLFYYSYMIPSWKQKYHRFWTHWINLTIVYTAYVFIIGIVKLSFSTDLLHPIIGYDLLLIWIKPIGHMWYLYSLLLMYLIYLAIQKVSDIIVIFSSFFLSVISTQMHIAYFDLYHVARLFFFFAIGVMLCKYPNWIENKMSKTIIIVLAIISFILAFHFWNEGIEIERVLGIQLIVGFGISLAIIFLFKEINFLNRCKPFLWCGSYSLEIYILHQYSVVVVLKLITMLRCMNVFVGYFVASIISLVSVIVLVEIMKKLKVYKYAFKPITIITKK